MGTLKDNIERSAELQASLEPLLQQYVFMELSSTNPIMRARACWLYGQFGSMKNCFKSGVNDEHLRHVINGIFDNLSHSDLPVRVEAAMALQLLLEHPIAIEFLRPGLGTLLTCFLKIMDDIDFDQLVTALQQIVDIYQEEIAPYAISLCQKLGDAYIRLINSKAIGDEEDSETSLTATGLMTAITRVLKSISGSYRELYPTLE
jgi:importin-7